MQTFSHVRVDVFTEVALQGNPLAIFTEARTIPEALLLPLTHEMGCSETVFVSSHDDAAARVRIFTPRGEIAFAGHPVLGTAAWLATDSRADTISIETQAGVVPVEVERRPAGIFGRMRQPIPSVSPYPRALELLGALGGAGAELPVELYDNGGRHLMVCLGSAAQVERLHPDLAALATHPACVSCFAGEGRCWRTRAFSPFDGVPEDPATGSAAGPLAVHLARHGRIRFGEELEISQGVELGRPSKLYARVSGSANALERVEVAGGAVVIGRGTLSF